MKIMRLRLSYGLQGPLEISFPSPLVIGTVVLEEFQPAQNAAPHHEWAEMQRLLKFFRGATMSDAYRLQAAVELEVVTLPVGSSSAQERWDGSYFVDGRQCSPTNVVGR